MSLQTMIDNQPELNDEGTGYLHDGQTLERVTKIIHKVLPPYLAPWAEGVGQKAALSIYEQTGELPGTIGELKKAVAIAGLTCEHEKNAGGDRGSALHLAVEAMIRTGSPTIDLNEFDNPEHKLYARSFAEFCVDYQPRFEQAEIRIVHPELRYAGTFDCVATLTARPKGARGADITGKKVILDWKTNEKRKIYEQHLVQLAAYELACDRWDAGIEGSAVVAIGPKREEGKSYSMKVNYFEPHMFEQVVSFYNMMNEQKKLNPLSRTK